MQQVQKKLITVMAVIVGCLIGASGHCFAQEKLMEQLLKPYDFEIKKKKLARLKTEATYVDEGDPNNPNVLVFIHGLQGYIPIWNKQITELKKQFRCIAIDLPGFGRSNKKNVMPGIVPFGDVVIKLLEALKINRVTLVGHSLGGQIAINLALRYSSRIKRIVLISSTGIETFTEKEKKAFRENVTPALCMNKTEEELQRDYKKYFFQTPVSAEFLFKDRLVIREAADFEQFCEINAKSTLDGLQQPTFEMLENVMHQTLIIYGFNDAYIPHPFFHVGQKSQEIAENARLRIRNSKVMIIPKCGHFAQFEQPDVVNNAIRDFAR